MMGINDRLEIVKKLLAYVFFFLFIGSYSLDGTLSSTQEVVRVILFFGSFLGIVWGLHLYAGNRD